MPLVREAQEARQTEWLVPRAAIPICAIQHPIVHLLAARQCKWVPKVGQVAQAIPEELVGHSQAASALSNTAVARVETAVVRQTVEEEVEVAGVQMVLAPWVVRHRPTTAHTDQVVLVAEGLAVARPVQQTQR